MGLGRPGHLARFLAKAMMTTDSTSQYDAIRAYLKELDIIDNVWIGLSKVSEKPNFTWTDFRPMNGEGHWQASVPEIQDAACVAMDPAADFLWKPLPCGGPDVASFICELPIPQWAMGSKGCLLTELPSLTVLYVPEQASLELTSDCGLDGTKRIACKGGMDREALLKQLTCSISDDDFDEKTTKIPIGSSTTSETSSLDDNSVNAKTTKTWIWTSNTIDIDYGMPTRHRRETEEAPLSTKSTTDVTTNEAMEVFTATNYDTEVTKSSLEIISTSDSTTSKYSVIESSSTENTDISTEQEEPSRHKFSTPADKTSNFPISDPTSEYPSAISQGQLFSIIENGTMFDIIELNDTNADREQKSIQEELLQPQTTAYKPSVKLNQLGDKNNKIPKDIDTNTKPLSKKDIYKNADPKKAKLYPMKNSAKSKMEKNDETNITKEIELYPIINDPSLKLNRTFRKELPGISKDHVFQFDNINENFKFSNSAENDHNNTMMIPFANDELDSIKYEQDQIKNVDNDQRQEIDPNIHILNNNATKTNDSDVELTIKDKMYISEENESVVTAAEEDIDNVTDTAEESTQDISDPYINSEESVKRRQKPNRQRQLTRPQRRSFYPYFFSRVLG